MRPEIERILNYFSGRNEVSALFLFGSFDTPGERSDSDIDIAVLIGPERADRERIDELKGEYYGASPGFSMRTVDIVILNTAPSALKYEILRTGRLLMERGPDFRKDFTARTLQEYFDYRPIEETYFRGVRGRLRRAVHG
jgi:predicted nucleotidyltransferase